MSRGTYSTSNYLYDSVIPELSSVPLTLAIWARTSSFPTDGTLRTLVNIGQNSLAPTSSRYRHALLQLDGTFYANTRNGSISQSSTASFTTADTWTHFVGVFAATNSRTLYIDGTAATTNTTNVSGFNTVALSVGCAFDGNGDIIEPASYSIISHVAVWTVALTAGEITMLAKRLSPLLVRPASLHLYYPMWRGNSSGDEFDLINSSELTETGTVSEQVNGVMTYIG